MTTVAAGGEPSILIAIRASQVRARRSFRLKFALSWAVIIGALLVALYVTGNADLGWISQWAGFILGGVGLTIFICLTSITIAVGFAILGALGRLSANAYVNGVASLYVSLVRGTPLLVQIYFVYYALPAMGLILDALVAGIFALAFNYGAYMTEIFRAGIQAVPKGQREAAQALGMRERLVMRRIVVPQAIRIVVPAIGNDFVSMIKDSSLVTVISVQELLWRANTAGRPDLKTLQALIVAAAVYWALTIIFSYFQARLEKRMARGDR